MLKLQKKKLKLLFISLDLKNVWSGKSLPESRVQVLYKAVYYLLLTAQEAIYATEVQKQADKVDSDAKEIKM